MHDVPREGLAEHLGLGGVHAHAPIDDLDERLAQHARHVYDLQTQSDQTDSEAASTDDDDDDSDRESGTHRRRRRSSRRLRSGRKRMSIVTSKYFDVPRLPPEFERELALDHDEDDGCGHGHARAQAFSGSVGGKKRRFFESGAVWDPVKRVITERVRAGVRGYDHGRVVNGVGGGSSVGIKVGDRDRDGDGDGDGDGELSREEADEMELDGEPEVEEDD